MKFYSISFSLLLALLGLSSIDWNYNTPLPTEVSNAYADLVNEKTQAQFLFTTSSEGLTHNLQAFLPSIFDRIDQVDLHYGQDEGYYYTVYGKKAGKTLVQTVLTTEEMGLNQDFPTLEELGLKKDDFFVYCYWKITRVTPYGISLSCQFDKTDLPICGRSVSGVTCFPLRPGEEIPHEQVPDRQIPGSGE